MKNGNVVCDISGVKNNLKKLKYTYPFFLLNTKNIFALIHKCNLNHIIF